MASCGRLLVGLRRRLSPALLVLLYHRVLPAAGAETDRLVVTCRHFAAHLQWLRRRAVVLGEPEFLELLDGRQRLRRPHVLITFDDGYADNVRHALPLLCAAGLKATLFVTTGVVGSGRLMWWDALRRLVRAALRRAAAGRPPRAPLPDGRRPDWTARFETAYRDLLGRLKYCPAAARSRFLNALGAELDVSLAAGAADRPATWAELRTWQQAGMYLGAHSRTHPALARLADGQLTAEIAGSKRDLERRLGIAVRSFAYPFGQREDFDRRATCALRQAGFACGLANRIGNVRWACDRYELPRCLLRDWDARTFAARLREWC